MKEDKVRNATMIAFEIQRYYIYPVCPRDSKIDSDKDFNDIDNGSMGGSHWSCFYIKDNKSFYFDSFGTTPDNFLLKQLPKPVICHK